MPGCDGTRVSLVCAAVALGSCMLVNTGTAAATSSKPLISDFNAAPASVASEGTVVVTAKVSGAEECRLSSNKAVAGLPRSFPCEGSVERQLTMPANAGQKVVKYKLE